MNEWAITVGVCVALVAVGGLAFLPWWYVLAASAWAIGAGLVVGVPAGLMYHVELYRALAPRDELGPRWIWNPVARHTYLRPRERRRVLAWFYAGGAGFVVILIGLVLLMAAGAGAALRG